MGSRGHCPGQVWGEGAAGSWKAMLQLLFVVTRGPKEGAPSPLCRCSLLTRGGALGVWVHWVGFRGDLSEVRAPTSLLSLSSVPAQGIQVLPDSCRNTASSLSTGSRTQGCTGRGCGPSRQPLGCGEGLRAGVQGRPSCVGSVASAVVSCGHSGAGHKGRHVCLRETASRCFLVRRFSGMCPLKLKCRDPLLSAAW